MIQRLLYTALTRGLDAIKADPTILDDLFLDNYELGQTEVDGIKAFFAAKPPTVVHGYARSDQEPPLYSIILASEREADAVIGDEAGMVDDVEDPDFGSDQYAALWEHTFHIMCLAEHPDVCTYLYEVAKATILQAKPTFIPFGVYGLTLSGQDLAPDPRYVPEHFFVRQLVVSCRAELLTTAKSTKLEKAFQVAGIHVDKSGSPSDVGGVKTLVTIDVSEDGE
jgi:hypothetical protein